MANGSYDTGVKECEKLVSKRIRQNLFFVKVLSHTIIGKQLFRNVLRLAHIKRLWNRKVVGLTPKKSHYLDLSAS